MIAKTWIERWREENKRLSRGWHRQYRGVNALLARDAAALELAEAVEIYFNTDFSCDWRESKAMRDALEKLKAVVEKGP